MVPPPKLKPADPPGVHPDGVVGITDQLYRLLLLHEVLLVILSGFSVKGKQNTLSDNVKLAFTGGRTQMVLEKLVIPQALFPDTNKEMVYVPGVLKVTARFVVDVPVQIPGLVGLPKLEPRLPFTVTKGLGLMIPFVAPGMIPEGPVICQYLL